MTNKLPVILDVDTGIDDAAAIIMACFQSELDIKLINCSFGNCEQSQTAKNTITVLENINKQNIPVSLGASSSLDNDVQIIRAHGVNGLGGYQKPISTKPISTPYYKAMHEIVSQNELTYIIACGPYTSIATYIKKYPDDINKIKLIAVTGSNYNDVVNPYLNFNINIDKKSLKYLLKTIPNIIFCTSDMGHKAYIPTSQFLKSAKCSEAGRFLATLYPSHKDRTVKDGAALHDACGVAWLVKPNMFKICFAKAEFKIAENGNEYLDFDYKSDMPNVVVTTDINKTKFYSWYYNTLKKIK
ncbi:MAG: nucleoside hydrolase [Clostridia bacterium]|nr:nucleoside hydrolase [Clostridia bacterium]